MQAVKHQEGVTAATAAAQRRSIGGSGPGLNGCIPAALAVRCPLLLLVLLVVMLVLLMLVAAMPQRQRQQQGCGQG